MMKLKMKFILALFIGTAGCAQLNNNYLPPAGASSAGGSGPGLQAPKGPAIGGSFAGANVPLSPPRPGGAPPLSPPRAGGAPATPGRPSSPAAPSGPIIEIISYENVNNGDGSFKWSYESANGIKAEETGDVKNKGSDNAIQTVQGSFSYTSPEGQQISITYVADENGFQPQGDAIPLPVPLPEANLKAIAEFEAAFATAKPDTGAGRAGSQPSAGSPAGAAPRPGSTGSSASSPPRPGLPASVGGAVRPPPGASSAGGFSPQSRPGGGTGNYSPSSGYSYR